MGKIWINALLKTEGFTDQHVLYGFGAMKEYAVLGYMMVAEHSWKLSALPLRRSNLSQAVHRHTRRRLPTG